jgi:undecaprenyl-diphosphatase
MPSKLQQKTTLFWILSVIFWLGLFACYLFFGDQQILFALNHHYNFGLDILNAIFSFFGRGDTIAIFFILLLFKQSFRNITYLKWVACYGIAASLINFLLKEYFKTPRPLTKYYGNVHIVKWLSQAYTHGFPSGHTLGIFSFASFIIFIFNLDHKKWHILLYIIAAGCGISRIYLGQHFASDVLFGEILGLLIGSTIGYYAKKELDKKGIDLLK